MVEWSRLTPLRQGSIVEKKVLDALALRASMSFPNAAIGMVVSHDCDIAASLEKEPWIELIPASFVPENKEKDGGSYTHAKEARTLYLEINISSNKSRFIELKANDKFRVEKGAFTTVEPSKEFSLTDQNEGILQRWLAARYRRHAFSDEFETRFNDVEKRFKEAISKSSKYIRAVLFDVDEKPHLDSDDGQAPFQLDIYLVYPGDEEKALTEATAAKVKIENAFSNKYKINGQWSKIELRSCEVVSDYVLTYIQYLNLTEWRAEGMSLKSNPPDAMTK